MLDELDEAELLLEPEEPEWDSDADKYPTIWALKQNIKQNIVTDSDEEQRLNNFIHSIASIKMKLKLNLSELI